MRNEYQTLEDMKEQLHEAAKLIELASEQLQTPERVFSDLQNVLRKISNELKPSGGHGECLTNRSCLQLIAEGLFIRD